MITEKQKIKFFKHVNKSEQEDSCHTWTGKLTVKGYGDYGIRNLARRAHQVAYIIEYGSIPTGMHVCHICDNRCCVNPKHLFLGTNADNVADKVKKNRQAKGSKIGAKVSGEGNGQAILTEDVVISIRTEYATGSFTQEELAIKYGVKKQTVGDIVRGRRWTNVGGPITKTNKKATLSPAELSKLQYYKNLGYSNRKISSILGVPRYTIDSTVREYDFESEPG